MRRRTHIVGWTARGLLAAFVAAARGHHATVFYERSERQEQRAEPAHEMRHLWTSFMRGDAISVAKWTYFESDVLPYLGIQPEFTDSILRLKSKEDGAAFRKQIKQSKYASAFKLSELPSDDCP